MNIFSYDVFSHIISFLDESEHIMLRETDKDTKSVMDVIYRNDKYIFPRKKLIYSSKKYIEWAIDHEYPKIHLKKLFRYNKNFDLDLIDYIYENIYSNKKFYTKSFLRCMIYKSMYNNKQILNVFDWLIKKLGVDSFLTKELFLECIFYNNLSILEFLKNNNCPYNKKHMETVMFLLISDYNFSPQYLQWIHKNLVDI